MTDFSNTFTPISVPALPAGSDANAIATFNASFVSNLANSANSLLLSSITLKNTDFYSVGDIPVLGPQLAIQFPVIDSKPTRSDPVVDWSTIETKLDQLAALATPSAPTLVTTAIDVPSLDATSPTIVLPAAPSTDVGAAPSGAPSIVEPTIPDAPVITLPTVPTFDELQLPSPPSFQLPAFTAVAPQNLLTPPTAQFAYVDPGYASSLHDPLVVKLLGDLQNGTYGIDPDVESALWFRARDRAAQQAMAEVEEARRAMAATSFPMPQGTMNEAIAQAEQKAQQLLSEANREIGIRRSDLYVEGRKFTIQQVAQYEKIRIDLYNATQERALNFAKATVELGIAVYDATVRNFAAQLEAYKTEASVFSERVRGELAKAELYRTQVEAEKLRVDFNRAKIEMFNAQLAAINSTVELYKSRLAAAEALIRVQAQRIEIFREQVLAYAERVRAKEAEYGIYQAQIKGQLAGLEVYKAQIDAYNARVAGLDAKARIQLQSNEALLQNFRAASQVYSNQLASFERQVSARLDEAKTKGTLYAVDVDAYRAMVGAVVDATKVYAEGARYVLDWNKASLASKVAQVEFRLKQLGYTVELQKDINEKGVAFMGPALAAAASGLNSLGSSSLSG